ncbi:uncharacterized protein N7487_007726, partial [Penicillium crustosum]
VNEAPAAWLHGKSFIFASSKQTRKCHTKEANPPQLLSPLPPSHSSQDSLKVQRIADLPTNHPVMPQWIGSLTSQNGNSLAGVFMINGEPWVFEKNARGQPAAPFQQAPAVVNIPWKELDSIRQSLQSCEPFTATIMGSTMEIVWSNGVRITANVPHCDTYGYFSGEGGWRTQ